MSAAPYDTGTLRRTHPTPALLLGSMGSVLLRAVYVVLQFSIGVVLARMLGPEALGMYAIAMAIVHLCQIPAEFGLPSFLVRSISVERTGNHAAGVRALVAAGLRIALFWTALICAGLGLWLWQVGTPFPSLPPAAAIGGIILLPLLTFLQVGGGIIRGLGHVLPAQLPSSCVRPLALLLALLLFAAAGLPLRSATEALLLHAAAATLALAVTAFFLQRYVPQDPGYAAAPRYRDWLRQSVPFMLLSGAQLMNYQVDILMLGALVSPDSVGHYRVAVEFSSGVGAATVAIGLVLGPMIASLHTDSAFEALQRLIVNAHRLGLALIAVPVGILLVYGEEVIRLVFGPAYLPAFLPLQVLLLGRLVYSLNVHAGIALSMSGLAWQAMWLTLASIMINVALNLLLIPTYGTVGAAVATAASMVIATTAGQILLRRKYGRTFSALAWRIRP